MGRDNWRFRQADMEREKRKRPNPVLRGLGCVLLIVFALGGWGLAGLFLAQNATHQWVYLPSDVLYLPFAPWLPNGALVQLIVAFVFVIFGFALLGFAYAVAFPVQRGEFDAPPPRSGPRRRR